MNFNERSRNMAWSWPGSLRCGALMLSLALLSAAPATAAEHTMDTLMTVKSRVDSGKAILLDVREQQEWDAGHIANAKLAPLSRFKSETSLEEIKKSLPKDKIIYCHCRSGGRCLIATEVLQKEGFDIRALKPGYQQLVEAGFPKAD